MLKDAKDQNLFIKGAGMLVALLLTLCCAVMTGSLASPKISIITSVYKGDQFIQGFMEDIVRQTIFDQCELILINANSPDNEEAAILPFVNKYPNIIYKKLDHDPGLYAVWNYAIQMSHGQYITNANVDDRLATNCYQIHAATLDAHPLVDLVYSDRYFTHTPNSTFASCCTGIQSNVFPEFSKESLATCWQGPNPMWRRSLHDKHGFFCADYKSAGDWEMWARAVAGGAIFKKVPGYYCLQYCNQEGLSTGKNWHKKCAEDTTINEKYGFLWGAPTYGNLYRLARSLELTDGKKENIWSLAFNYYLQAFSLQFERAEPLIRIAQHYLNAQDYWLAFLFAQRAVALPMPSAGQDLIEPELYEYTRFAILAQAALQIGELAAGNAALEKAIEAHPSFVHLHDMQETYKKLRGVSA